MYSCPYCHKQIKDLKSHIARVHPDKVDKQSQRGETSDKSDTPVILQEFKVKKPPTSRTKKVIKEEETPEAKYHCIACGGDISHGQSPCPHCGAELDWSQV